MSSMEGWKLILGSRASSWAISLEFRSLEEDHSRIKKLLHETPNGVSVEFMNRCLRSFHCPHLIAFVVDNRYVSLAIILISSVPP